ncbi:MFS transporter [Rhodospirillaceae bacterium SYSU D60014]|uniref:MFS transporter n=1 Tax=Virgifigura deserti TaxID=2268457 RepID=UPI000E662345
MTDRSVSPPTTLDRAYEFLGGDMEERGCAAIPAQACTDVPRNFLLNVANGAATKLAEQLASPGLVLPWLLSAIGAPTGLVGLLVPARQAGSLLPQLAVAGQIRRIRRRKWVWVGAGAIQAAMLLLMAVAALALPPTAAGLAIVAFLSIFSVVSGMGSVAFQDVVGKTVPQGKRGRLLAQRAAIGGALTLAAAILLKSVLSDEASVGSYALLLAVAAALWAFAAIAFAVVIELPGATEGGRSMIREVRSGFRLVRDVPGYRRFLVARALLVAVEVATPFFALHAQGLSDENLGALAAYIFALGLAEVLSNPVWGALADKSSRRVMALSGLVAAAAGFFALGLALLPPAAWNQYVYAPIFILIGAAQAGVRVGRKTYLVDAAPERDRPLYVAFANSAVGVVTLAAGALGLLAALIGVPALIALLALLALAGAAAAWALHEADRMVIGKGAKH